MQFNSNLTFSIIVQHYYQMQICFPQSLTSHVREKVVNIAYMGGASAVQLVPSQSIVFFWHDFPLCCSLGNPAPQAIYEKAPGNHKV